MCVCVVVKVSVRQLCPPVYSRSLSGCCTVISAVYVLSMYRHTAVGSCLVLFVLYMEMGQCSCVCESERLPLLCGHGYNLECIVYYSGFNIGWMILQCFLRVLKFTLVHQHRHEYHGDTLLWEVSWNWVATYFFNKQENKQAYILGDWEINTAGCTLIRCFW